MCPTYQCRNVWRGGCTVDNSGLTTTLTWSCKVNEFSDILLHYKRRGIVILTVLALIDLLKYYLSKSLCAEKYVETVPCVGMSFLMRSYSLKDESLTDVTKILNEGSGRRGTIYIGPSAYPNHDSQGLVAPCRRLGRAFEREAHNFVTTT